jgi:phage terminase large subunit-like protein
MGVEAEVIVVAAARDQADVLRRQADQLVKRSGRRVIRANGVASPFEWVIDGSVFEVKSGLREIRCGEARMRVMAADAATGDGVIPTLALVDELHRHRSMELYEVLADGLSAPAPQGMRGSLKDFERFCGLLTLDTGKKMHLEEHERRILRLYFAGYSETVTIIGKKNGKTTLMAALGLYHLKTGSPIRQMITISTAGTDEESPLGKLRTRAHAMPEFSRRGKVNTARTADKAFAWLEWCLDPEDDRTDFDLVKKVNPASWHTVESLRRSYEKPSRTEGSWARFRCGVWTAGEESWLEANEWDGLAVDIGGVVEGEPVWASVVYGKNPAIAIAAARPDDLTLVEDEEETVSVLGAAVKVTVFEGKPSFAALEKELAGVHLAYDLQAVLYDAAEFGRSAELLEARGVPMLEIPHSVDRLARATTTLQRVIQAGILRHDGDEVLRSQMLRSVIKETTRTRYVEKGDGSRGVVALAVAVHQATTAPEVKRPPRIYTLTTAEA